METCRLPIILFLVHLSLAQELPWLPSPLGTDWLDLHEGFVNNSRLHDDHITVLFVGDSITRRWQTDGLEVYDKYYVPIGAANYGVGGDSTQHVIK